MFMPLFIPTLSSLLTMIIRSTTAGNLSRTQFGNTLFPHRFTKEADYEYPLGSLLQVSGVVQHSEFRDPHHLDVNGEECLLVVKNGLATGTTVGRANGLESFTRVFCGDGSEYTSISVAILPYDRQHGKFSAAGDSGSIVLDRDGRIVGLLTSGAGAYGEPESDISYITPYWWLEQQIKAKYPDCALYE